MADRKGADEKHERDSWEDVRVSLGPDAEVTGKLSFSVPTRIEGKLRGEIRVSSLLVIGPQAVVNAAVTAERLLVLGRVEGEVRGRDRVEIRAGGRLVGDVTTRCLVVEEGGLLEGNCQMEGTPRRPAPAAEAPTPGR